ncbi:MAG: pyridoxal 5'-phosphate synthase glutaminase subunit PdxT [Dehalococcoidia bacterium]|jgi:5'-phosphate synthase pdxT subunit|nr:pyridoxal 5'-phosphate synthase glutaminase subunit PdxT [Dehalococcoidia bacterium]MDP6782821.1 pyridoxal 5'-phosphate synthase glutaminase subunit PdxT [Dehalococcoidia bacterium]
MTGNGTRVGVLALQGAFAEHLKALNRLKLSGIEVRRAADLEGLSGLIIPGGESTAIGRLLAEMGLREPILRRVAEGMAVMGTCAGMILLAGETSDYPLEPLGLMDITVRRNAFGRQVDSFETPVAIAALGAMPFPAVFIRAPCIEKVGTAVEALGRLNDGRLVAARQGKLLALAFHPELTRDTRCHGLFVEML